MDKNLKHLNDLLDEALKEQEQVWDMVDKLMRYVATCYMNEEINPVVYKKIKKIIKGE